MKTSDEVFAEVAATWTPEQRAEYEQAGEDVELALHLAELVYQARTEAGMTQADLARAMGVSQSHVSALEGGGAVPTVRTLARVAKATRRHLRIDLDAA